MKRFCFNCGKPIAETARFCLYCGIQQENESVAKIQTPPPKKVSPPVYAVTEPLQEEIDFQEINKNLQVRNTQNGVVRVSLFLAFLFLLVLVVGFTEIVPVHPALAFLSIFLLLASLAVAWIFKNRSKKLASLINGEQLLASWQMGEQLQAAYVDHLFQHEKNKNRAIFTVIGVLMVLIFGGFILFMEEGKLFMLCTMLIILFVLAIFAFGMPYYYRNKNRAGDGIVMIGAKYAYINGYFHNWDYPLSGLQKIKAIKKPFYGIHLVYFYTDRTLENTEELYIPVPTSVNLSSLIEQMKHHNS